MNDLVVLEKIQASIKWNKTAATKEANAIMKKYKGLELTDEQIPNAKKEIATLRKVSIAINQQAVDIDKELNTNVKVFREEVKGLKKIDDDGINFIDKQVKAYETKVKDDKKKEIIELEEYIAIKDYYSFDESWLNKAVTIKKIIAQLVIIKVNYDADINTIKMMATSHNIESEKYIAKLESTPLDIILQRIVDDSSLVKEVKDEPIIVKSVVIKKDEPIQSIVRKLTGTIIQLKKVNEYCAKIGVEWSKL